MLNGFLSGRASRSEARGRALAEIRRAFARPADGSRAGFRFGRQSSQALTCSLSVGRALELTNAPDRDSGPHSGVRMGGEIRVSY